MGPATTSNTFRKEYRELTAIEKGVIENLKIQAEVIEVLINEQKVNGKNPRALALAMTKLEESVMWAVKAITE